MKLALLNLLWLSLVAGCSLIPLRTSRPPTATINLPSGAGVTQSGDAQVPAKVSTDTIKTTVPLPAASELVFDEKAPGIVTFRLSKDSSLTTETHREKAEAPQAFTPPAPPTVNEMADARARLLYRVGLAIGVAAALFGLVRGWDLVMYGGGTVAGACSFALFVQNNPVLFAVIGVGIGLAVIGPWIWHTKLKHLETPPVTP